MLDIINNSISNVNFGEIITTVVIAALGTFIAKVRPYVKELLDNLVKYILVKIESSQYEDQFKQAYDIWKLVDENFRIGAEITKEFESKAEYFDNLLLQKFPSLSQGQIDYIRQVVAGNENSAKGAADSSQAQSDVVTKAETDKPSETDKLQDNGKPQEADELQETNNSEETGGSQVQASEPETQTEPIQA